MSYWDNYETYELKLFRDKLVFIANDLEIQLNIYTNIINDIDNSIEGRKV